MNSQEVGTNALPGVPPGHRVGRDFADRAIAEICEGLSLDADKAERMMELVINSELSSDAIELYLTSLAEKGESVDELVGSATALRRACVKFPACGPLLDNCGTGGDGAGTFNISTVAALVIASAGQPIVKHGNRSASGRVGSADLLEALGIDIALDVEPARRCLTRTNFAFLFAPRYHPAAKSVASIRRRIGRPTIFNWLGPICNPANPQFQLLGVPNARFAETIALTCLRLGLKRAFVVSNSEGVDELMPFGENRVLIAEDGRIEEFILNAQDANVDECMGSSLQGGDVARNKEIALEVLSGAKGARRDAVLLNAAAALLCTRAAGTLIDGMRNCARAIDSGKTIELLRHLQKFHDAEDAKT